MEEDTKVVLRCHNAPGLEHLTTEVSSTATTEVSSPASAVSSLPLPRCPLQSSLLYTGSIAEVTFSCGEWMYA